MIYNTLHLLFGWDYIHWSNAFDRGIARVRVDGLGRVWYWRYRSTKVADLIAKPEQVLWLTCEPNKYFAAIALAEGRVAAVEGEKNDPR